MNNLLSIGITSIGSGVGKSIVDSCRLSNLPLHTIGFGTNPLAFSMYDCDEFVELPPISDAEYISQLLATSVTHKIQFLIPGHDLELILLSENKQLFADQGITVLVSGLDFLRFCRDKTSLSSIVHDDVSVFVPSYTKDEAFNLTQTEQLKFPLIAKPLCGCASKNIRILLDSRDFASVSEYDVVQPVCLPDKQDPHYSTFCEALNRRELSQLSEISIQLVIGKNGQLLGKMASCNTLARGVPIEIVPIETDIIWSVIDRLIPHFLSLGLYGPLNLQGRISEGKLTLFEMNARFTGITGIRALMGFNEVEAMVADHFEIECVPDLRINCDRVGIRQVSDRLVSKSKQEIVKRTANDILFHPQPKERKKVFITGSTGYLGQNLIRSFLTKNEFDVIAYTRDLHRAQQLFEGSLSQIELVNNLDLSQVDIVIHAAFGREPTGKMAIAESLSFTKDLIRQSILYQVPSFITISSQSVYGQQKPPWNESMKVEPATLYAMAKKAEEEMTSLLHELSHQTSVTSLRLARLFGAGPGLRWDELPHLFVKNVFEQKEISIWGGEQRLDLLSVNDAVAGIVAICSLASSQWKGIYNLGSGSTVTPMDIVMAINEVTSEFGLPGAKIVNSEQSSHVVAGMDIVQILNDTGWKPTISLHKSIRELFSLLKG